MIFNIVLVALFLGIEETPVVNLQIKTDPASFNQIIIDENGLYYLSILFDPVIHVFDPSGKALPVIGRSGEGPGEFLFPRYMSYDHPMLYIMDSQKRKLFLYEVNKRSIISELKVPSLDKYQVVGTKIFAVLNRSVISSGIDYAAAMQKLESPFEQEFVLFPRPCCRHMSGVSDAAILVDRDGAIWVTHTGEYRVEKYSSKGKLLNAISKEPPGYGLPKLVGQQGLVTPKLQQKYYYSFDKLSGLFEVGSYIILYRFRHFDESYLDIYDHEGNIITLGYVVSGKAPIYSQGDKLFFMKPNEAENAGDIDIISLDFSKIK